MRMFSRISRVCYLLGPFALPESIFQPPRPSASKPNAPSPIALAKFMLYIIKIYAWGADWSLDGFWRLPRRACEILVIAHSSVARIRVGLFSQKVSLAESKAWSALKIYLALEDLFQKAVVVILPDLLLWKQTLLQSFGAFSHILIGILFKSFAMVISPTNFLELDSSLSPASGRLTQVISLCIRAFAIVWVITWYIALPQQTIRTRFKPA